MYTTIIHPLRKALNLSMHEYAVLDSIMKLSNNTQYSGWCVISREKLSNALDLSKPTIIKIYDTLEQKGLILKNSLGHARPSQDYIDLFNPGNEIQIAVANESQILASVKNFTSGKETLPDRLRNFTESGKETLPNNNKDNSNNIIDWKNDFETYKSDLRKAYLELVNDIEWVKQQEKYHPNIDIILSIDKACVNYWATEAGWNYKKKKRTKELNWKSTLTNAIQINKVYKQRSKNEY